jgi:predicted DNA-binding transcriptional regulator AlpA
MTRRRRLRLADCHDTLTIAQVASVLGISVSTIDKQLHDGVFPIPVLPIATGRTNRRRIWTRVAVQRFIDTGAQRLTRTRVA